MNSQITKREYNLIFEVLLLDTGLGSYHGRCMIHVLFMYKLLSNLLLEKVLIVCLTTLESRGKTSFGDCT